MNELTLILLTTITTPLILTIIALPTLYSKTFIKTFVQNPYSFNTRTAYTYIKTMLFFYTPITVLWGSILLIGQLLYPQTAPQTLTTIAALSIISTLVLPPFSSRYYTKTLQNYLSTETRFNPETPKQTRILTIITTLHATLAFLVFFALLIFA